MAAALVMAGTLVLAGCGTNVNTPLPEPNARTQINEGPAKPKTAAEQKKAIDDLVAKRDALK